MIEATVLLSPVKSAVPAEGGVIEVMVRVQAPDQPDAAKAKITAKRLALVVDRSGSMDGHRTKPLEGPTMATQPGGGTLVPDELDVLVARETQGHHKRPGPPQFVIRMHEHRAGAKVHLDCLARCEVESAAGLWRLATSDIGQDTAHRRVAAAPALFALERGEDGDTGDALLSPALYAFALRCKAVVLHTCKSLSLFKILANLFIVVSLIGTDFAKAQATNPLFQ